MKIDKKMMEMIDDIKRIPDILESARQTSNFLKILNAQQEFVLWVSDKHPRIIKEWRNHCRKG